MTKRTGRHLLQLWDATDPPDAVEDYLSAQWEFDPGDLESAYPYAGPVNRSFRVGCDQRFHARWNVLWCLAADHVRCKDD